MYLTKNSAAKVLGVPPFLLYTLQKKGLAPGFYSGNRFYFNVEMLREKFEEESRAAIGQGNTHAN